MTGGTFTGHGALCSCGRLKELVKNADENWPTAPGVFFEVMDVWPVGNRDDSRKSPAEWALAGCTKSG
ncbi:hypothetical protein ACFY5C_24855 [Streptomyces sp. NPDC012935]|uniref:hypothetical protein n=1 Tax=Streptomyces sp. NPDC012935 TaxID=3364857 RepID=UPI00368A5CDC